MSLYYYNYEDLLKDYYAFLQQYRPPHHYKIILHYQPLQGLRLASLFKEPLASINGYRVVSIKGYNVIFPQPCIQVKKEYYITIKGYWVYKLREFLEEKNPQFIFKGQLPFRKAIMSYVYQNFPLEEVYHIDAFIMGHKPQAGYWSHTSFKFYLQNLEHYIRAYNIFKCKMERLDLWRELYEDIVDLNK